mmetsp:Transcript_11734/g.29547  ORF Transcript_11734/g.29547 Transcript_11734/m.29547 type:complete len:185 (-) Transcript_11734:187-741(-)
MPRDQPDDAPDKEEAVRQRCQAFEERMRAKYLDLLQRKNDAARQFESAQAQLGQAVTAHDEWRQELQQKHAARLEEKAKAAKSLVQQHEQSKQRARPQDVPEHRAWEYFGANCRGLSDSFQVFEPMVEPVLEPFVSGMVEPLSDVMQSLQVRALLVVAITSAVSFGVGWVVGRRFGRGGAGKES